MTAASKLDDTARRSPCEDKATRRPKIGILALQGAFAEHSTFLTRLGADVREVRLPEQFDGLDGIVLPGGESTSMALIGERWGVFPRLKRWVSEGRPVWGTCAGMILLSDSALMTKLGGQSLVGGLDVEVCRNYFGAQKSSFEVPLDTSKLRLTEGTGKSYSGKSTPYPAVFIRAPAILEAGPGVEVLCKVRAAPCEQAVRMMKAQLEVTDTPSEGVARKANGNKLPEAKCRRLASYFMRASSCEDGEGCEVGRELPEVIVAVRKGNILATAFHPELTNDQRWHMYFLGMVNEALASSEDEDRRGTPGSLIGGRVLEVFAA